MQDAGGVRVIVKNMEQLELIDTKIHSISGLKSEKDYIKNPKPSGYRGKHFIFKKDGTLIEIQLRTALQHLWATSVETVDVFQGTSMKTALPNDQTENYWQEFFNLVSSVFAGIENSPYLAEHQNMELEHICGKLMSLMEQYKIADIIKTYATIDFDNNTHDIPNAYYAVVRLDGQDKNSLTKYYIENDYQSAIKEYQNDEQLLDSEASVLVSVSSVNKIQQIYPNYYMNLTEFMSTIKEVIDTYHKNWYNKSMIDHEDFKKKLAKSLAESRARISAKKHQK